MSARNRTSTPSGFRSPAVADTKSGTLPKIGFNGDHGTVTAAARAAALRPPLQASIPAAAWLSMVAFAAVIVAVAVQHVSVPPIRAASAPPEEGFSAGRTQAVVNDLVACGLKYAGSPELEDCAVKKLQGHVAHAIRGYEEKVQLDLQSASGHFYIGFLGGFTNIYKNITNVVARLRGHGKGRNNSCALLISAHFDSALGSPAASDDIAEIAIMVELLHLLVRDPPDVDVIFNFNGGEETIMQAAHGFTASHPWAKDACAVINLEGGVGSGGREILFQAGPQNRWIAEAYQRTAQRPHASSAFQAVFQLGIIPGDTDYRVYRDFGGMPGADFAITQNGWVYHTRNDDMRHMDFRSVQNYGDTVLPLAREMSKELSRGVTLKPSAETLESAVYFDILGAWLIFYSEPVARSLHFTGAAMAGAWALFAWCPGRTHEVWEVAFRLCTSFLMSLVVAIICGALLAFSPRALIGHGHPEVTPLLFGAPAVIGFTWRLRRHWPSPHTGALTEPEQEVVAAASVLLAAITCISLTLDKSAIMIAYVPFAWAVLPALADAMSHACPYRMRSSIAVLGHVLPWMLLAQLSAILFDVFIPLTGRSGTLIPGDVVQAGCYGFLLGVFMMFSARFLVALPEKHVHRTLWIVFLLGVVLTACLFPYSGERLKRAFMQHTKRVHLESNLTSTGLKQVRVPRDSSGIWTVGMDWNGISTLRDQTPFGLPENSTLVDDSAGLYGEVPHYFPLRQFMGGGTWTPIAAPQLPSSLTLSVTRGIQMSNSSERLLHFSVSGGTQIMAALGPRSAIRGWSLGHLEGGFGPKGAARRWLHGANTSANTWPGGSDWELPPARSDCDCIWVFFTEGGLSPSHGRAEAFSFSAVVATDEVHIDLWAAHLTTISPEIKEQVSRQPSWVDLHGWSTELQLHTIHL